MVLAKTDDELQVMAAFTRQARILPMEVGDTVWMVDRLPDNPTFRLTSIREERSEVDGKSGIDVTIRWEKQ